MGQLYGLYRNTIGQGLETTKAENIAKEKENMATKGQGSFSNAMAELDEHAKVNTSDTRKSLADKVNDNGENESKGDKETGKGKSKGNKETGIDTGKGKGKGNKETVIDTSKGKSPELSTEVFNDIETFRKNKAYSPPGKLDLLDTRKELPTVMTNDLKLLRSARDYRIITRTGKTRDGGVPTTNKRYVIGSDTDE
jgi:hypothetical protein